MQFVIFNTFKEQGLKAVRQERVSCPIQKKQKIHSENTESAQEKTQGKRWNVTKGINWQRLNKTQKLYIKTADKATTHKCNY